MDFPAALLDLRVLILCGLALLDLILGTLAQSIRTRFDPDKFGNWLATNVLSIVIPYVFVLIAVMTQLPKALPAFPISAEVVAWLLLLPGAFKIGYSLYRNLRVLFNAPPTAA